MKLTKPFKCVPDGHIYPIEIAEGEDCPPEHEESARAQGCLPAADEKPAEASAKK